MSETDFNSVPLNQRPQLETLVSSQAVTALHAQLTAAQSRVAELEADLLDHKQLLADKRDSVKELIERVAELERETKGWKNLLRAEGDSAVKQVADLTTDNQRLRESITTLQSWLEEEYGYYKRQIGDYARGYRDGLDAADTKLDGLLKINAAIGEGE